MKGQVGYWGYHGGGLAVCFGEEMLRWVDALGTERRVSVEVDRSRLLTVRPDGAGTVVSRLGSKCHRDFTHSVRSNPRHHDGPGLKSIRVDADLLPFGLTVLEFDDRGDCLRCELPYDYELEWPRLEVEVDYGGRSASEVAEEVLQARILSLVASGQSSFRPQQRPHDAFRRLLAPGAWAKCLATAKTLSGA